MTPVADLALTSTVDTFEEEYHNNQAQEQSLSVSARNNNEEEEEVEEEKQPLQETQNENEPKEVLEEDDEPLLTEDSYSLLYTAAPCSRTSLFAMFSITLQGGMLLLTFLDLFDISEEGNDTNGETNRLQLNVGSTREVMIAQFIGMLVTALIMAAEGDFVVGITQLIKGYDPKITDQCPNATWTSWLFSGLLQSIVGLLLLFDSFVLSMQSAAVIDLSMNLTALFFIQEIDNQAFTLAVETGLVGRGVKEDCEHVQNCRRYATASDKRSALILRRGLIALMTIGLLVPYFIIIVQQLDGHYVCSNLYIQFGDVYTPEMAYYSGLFRSQGNGLRQRKGQRNYYVEDSKTFKVAYCNADNYWTVSRIDDRPCDFIFRSAETDTFDIIEAADLDWYVTTPSTGEIDVDWLKIVCNDCNADTCPSEFGVCSEAGDRCLCHESEGTPSDGLKRFGLGCQFQEICRHFALDKRTEDGLSAIPGTSAFLGREYYSLYWNETPWDTPRFYGFPIYVPVPIYFPVFSNHVDSYIIYTGRRWVLYAIPDENLATVVEKEGRPSNWTRDDFEEFFDDLGQKHSTNINALMDMTAANINYFPIFFSSPINYGEDSFGVDPSRVTWFHATTPYNITAPLMPASPDESQPVPAMFLCTDCLLSDDGNNDDLCLNGGYCNDYGGCVCETYYTGYKCERVKDCVGAGGCLGGGTCNKETKTCECQEGSYGNLCQLGLGALEDPFLCPECDIDGYGVGHGKCNSTFSQQCTCYEGYGGYYCNETIAIANETMTMMNATLV